MKIKIIRTITVVGMLAVSLMLGMTNPASAVYDPRCPQQDICPAYECTDWLSCDPSEHRCYRRTDCADGSWTCGAACPDEQDPNNCSGELPGGCGGNGCPTNQRPIFVCDGSGNRVFGYCQNDAACIPNCTQTPPSIPSLVQPENGSTTPSNDVVFEWDWGGSSWGEGCPTTPERRLQLRKRGETTYTTIGNVTGKQKIVADLEWDTEYQWRVIRLNNPNDVNDSTRVRSQVRTFRTPKPPEIIAAYFVPSTIAVCGGAPISGREAYDTTNNPIQFVLEVRDARNNFATNTNVIDHVRLAFTPRNQNHFTFATLDPILYGPDAFAFKGSSLTTTPAYSAMNSRGAFAGNQTTGTLATDHNIAQLRNIGSNTKVERLDNQTLRITMEIAFMDTYPTTDLVVYGAVVSRLGDGNLVSQDPVVGTANGHLRYTRVKTWGTDMQPPAATISNAQITGVSEYRVTWSGSDNEALRLVRSYCSLAGEGQLSVRNQELNTLVTLRQQTLNFPMSDQCFINSTARLNRAYTYRIEAGEFRSDIVHKLTLQDTACNLSTAINSFQNPAPWLFTHGSNVSANGGFDNINIPDVNGAILTAISPTLGNGAYLTTYLAISGNTLLPPDRRSEKEFFTRTYDNWDTRPSDILATTSWYEAIRTRLVQQGLLRTVVDATLSGSLSRNYGVPQGSAQYLQHNGNLHVLSNTICDIKAIIVVSGNLIVDPKLTRNGNGACMFVVKGNITITPGERRVPGDITKPAIYDTVHGFFVTDAMFVTQLDNPGLNQLRDGLYLWGTVVAKSVDFNRDLGLTHNGSQPAEVIEYDSVYYETFQAILAMKTFSLREQ